MSPRRRSQKSKYKKSSSPGGLFYAALGGLAGAAVGSVATALLITKTPDNALPLPANVAAKHAVTKTAKASKPKFDFYTILSETETVDSGHTVPTVVAKSKKTAASNSSKYILQIASFKSAAEAEEQKARLALLGVQVGIEKVLVNGETWFRVRQGPVTGLAKVERMQKQLQAKDINSLRLKLHS